MFTEVVTNVGDQPTSNAKVGKCQLSSHPRKRSDSMSLRLIFGQANCSERAAKSNYKNNPFAFCFCFCNRGGEVVTRDELRQELWSADTFVDFDHGLNSAVARLREALRDSAEKPRFIETVAKRGYRFIAPIQPNNEAHAVAATVAVTDIVAAGG